METSAGEFPDPAAALDDDTAMTGNRTDGNSEFAPNVMHQRRRVNPESLALRLGPDLVRDLDALITPGNTEMPSFVVRKELQERYNIDRRHIYDYFHSRGLRVVKEDKHGNPLPAKSMDALILPNLRPLRQAPVKNNVRSHSSCSALAVERNLLKPRGITKAKPGRPKKIPATIVPCETNEPTDRNASVSEHCSPDATPKPTYIAVNPLLPRNPTCVVQSDENCVFNSVINPLDESFSVRRAIGDISYAYRHKVVFERMQELTAEHSVKSAPSDDHPLSWNETSPCSSSAGVKGLLLPHARPLTRDERHAVYETLSDSIGPARGIQERQGTYRKHMEARTKVYFEGVLSVPRHHSQPPVRTSALLDRNPPLGTNEYRHWLSETRLLKREGSPRHYSRHRNVNVVKQQDVDGVIDKHSRQRSHWLQGLDELFPISGSESLCNDGHLTDSPIARTGEDEHWPLSSTAMSSPKLSVVPVTSVAETNSHPQSLGCDARVSQQLDLSDALRKGRNMSNFDARICLSSRKPHMRDPDRIRTRPVTSRDARRRTTSAAGDI